MSQVLTPHRIDPLHIAAHGDSRTGVASAALRRVVLVGACMLAVAVAWTAGRPEALLAHDPELGVLLRGMAVLKASFALAASALAFWRFGHAVSPAMAAVYVVAVALMSGAAMLVWQLTLIPLAAIAFHAGLLAMLAVAWADRGGVSRMRPR